MAVLPVGAYFPQLQIIKQQQSIGSFSVYICADVEEDGYCGFVVCEVVLREIAGYP